MAQGCEGFCGQFVQERQRLLLSDLRKLYTWYLALLCLLFLPLTLRAATLIDQAQSRGSLDPLTAALYRVYAVRAPDMLPLQFRQEILESPGCAAPLFTRLCHFGRHSSQSVRAKLAKALVRPELDYALVTESGRFRIHYDKDGPNAVNTADLDSNGIPDYVDIVAAVLDSIWALEVDQMGYPFPPHDGDRGGEMN